MIIAEATAYSIPAISDGKVIRAVGTWVDSPADCVNLQIQDGDESISIGLTPKKARLLAKSLAELAAGIDDIAAAAASKS